MRINPSSSQPIANHSPSRHGDAPIHVVDIGTFLLQRQCVAVQHAVNLICRRRRMPAILIQTVTRRMFLPCQAPLLAMYTQKERKRTCPLCKLALPLRNTMLLPNPLLATSNLVIHVPRHTHDSQYDSCLFSYWYQRDHNSQVMDLDADGMGTMLLCFSRELRVCRSSHVQQSSEARISRIRPTMKMTC